MAPTIDTTKSHSARMYDYYLGGKDNFAADRATAEKAMQSWGAVRTAVRENRGLPRPCRPASGQRGWDSPVPGHRHGLVEREQRARGRAGGWPLGRFMATVAA